MHLDRMYRCAKTRSCVDCQTLFAALAETSQRCQACQRRFVNTETSRRDAARRRRKQASVAIGKALGITGCRVVRDNGHRCQSCRRVLWVAKGKARHHCKQCEHAREVADALTKVLGFLVDAIQSEWPECTECGGPSAPWCGTMCSDACRKEHNRARSRQRYERLTGVRLRPASGDRPCRLCSLKITPDVALGRGRSVCDYCNLHRGTFKSRAIMYGVKYEHVSRAAVFRRDGWRCQLCSKKVLRKAKRNRQTRRLHPRTASLDHIIPMSKGGDHVEANVQCACLACNVRKNARVIGQTRLF